MTSYNRGLLKIKCMCTIPKMQVSNFLLLFFAIIVFRLHTNIDSFIYSMQYIHISMYVLY